MKKQAADGFPRLTTAEYLDRMASIHGPHPGPRWTDDPAHPERNDPIRPPVYDSATLSPDGWDCTHEPPHGIRLAKEKLYVLQRHFPDEAGYVLVMPNHAHQPIK